MMNTVEEEAEKEKEAVDRMRCDVTQCIVVSCDVM